MAEEAEDIIGEDGADAPEDGGSKRKKLILFIVQTVKNINIVFNN